MNSIAHKKILFFQNSILPANGGVPRVSDIIATELTKRGHDCYFVYYDRDNELYTSDSKLKVNLKGNYQDFEREVLQFIEDRDIDVFICQNTYFSSFIRLFKQIRLRYPANPFLCFLHASPDYWKLTYQTKYEPSSPGYLFNSLKSWVKKVVFSIRNPYIKTTTELYHLCDRFVLLSESFKESFISIYSISDTENKLVSIPNPLTFADYITAAELAAKEKVVLIISRLDESQKKISVALKIWKLLSPDHQDWKLFIVGGGPDEQLYRNYVKDHQLKNVKFFGQQIDVIDFHKKASILMMTSVWEGLPMALLEAQQNGVVPIAFDNFSAIYDVITHGENGYIIKNNNEDDFAHSLSVLMQDSVIRRNMALKSVENSKRYHVSHIADLWEDLFSLDIQNLKA
jgi:glycosyltransferase involved in cell wall biosynthesis